MNYIENPKTKGSGILCCIPQTGTCPENCSDCFFQSGRSYLEPLHKNLPNMPSPLLAKNKVVRVNDGNDSSYKQDLVVQSTQVYPQRFYNTSTPLHIEKFDAPVVLTLNPGHMTDNSWAEITPPDNLMFVRIRVNMWNLHNVVWPAIFHYTKIDIPVVLTFMAYYNETIPKAHKDDYKFRKRTLNSYWCITPDAWLEVMNKYKSDKLVHSCGVRYSGTISCKYCGNCLREYFATIERMK